MSKSKVYLVLQAVVCIALAILCFALVWFNFLDPAVKQESADDRNIPAATVSDNTETEEPVASDDSAVAEAPAEVDPDIAAEEPAETDPDAATEAPAEADQAAAAEAPGAAGYDSEAPMGHEVGQQLPDFTLQCYDGTAFHLADARGKITFINLWATYCTPCIHELPYFSELYAAHEGDIAMVAVHSKLVTMDPVTFIADKGFCMPFATDTDGEVTKIVGGTGVLPQTIVLNRKGEVIYNQVGSVTPEVLAELYDEADK